MPLPINRPVLVRIACALAAGMLLHFAVGLEPVWWLAWIAPVPLLVLAWREPAPTARWMTGLAALVGIGGNLHYYTLVMGVPFALAVTAGQAALWVLVVGVSRRMIERHQRWWVVFVYPTLWAAVDMLEATLLPDGNWGSLAYSQSEFLPALQVTALFGVPGLLFLLALAHSALAMAVLHGRRLGIGAYAAPALIVGATLGYGTLRLQTPVFGDEVVVGLAAIDDAIGAHASPGYAARILDQYDRHIEHLAAQGATVIVLPEKILITAPVRAEQWRLHLAAMAARLHVWIEAGIGVDDGRRRINLEWLIDPDGKQAAIYQKQHLAPPEREFVAGNVFELRAIRGAQYGLAICKDMHFASLGRAYGGRGAAVMLVPAWDFYLDRWNAARTTLTRGVESGFSVVRSSREGLMTVSDAYGRVLHESPSSAMPGNSLLARLQAGPALPTVYARIGDVFGWLCVAAAMLIMAAAWRPAAQDNAT